MGLLSALQYGLSGLSAILFLSTVAILRSEQRRRGAVRTEIIVASKAVMILAAFLIVVPASVEIARKYLDDSLLQQQISNLSPL